MELVKRKPDEIKLIEAAEDYARAAKSNNTRRAYKADWSHFVKWAEAHGTPSLPASPEAVILYISDIAKSHKITTIKRRLVAINQAHKLHGYESPITSHVMEILKGIRNTRQDKPTRKKPLLFTDIARIVEAMDDDLKGKRDKAMILLGYAGFLRRSELCTLKAQDVEITDNGLIITLAKTKTGHNETVAIERGVTRYCPVTALQEWLEASGITEGYLFPAIDKGGRIINPDKPITTTGFVKLLKYYIQKIGLNPEEYGGHSLRAGGATQAALNRANESDIKRHGRWRTQVYQDYIRKGSLFRDNPSGKLGL